jgi:membrane-bound inhibitor of C-type lysozyme
MKTSAKTPILAAAGLAVLVAGSAFAEEAVATATFKCAGSKAIDATFYADKVDLTLTDGRSLELPQVISGSGARYANADESFVFWNKGDTAFITEGPDDNGTMTYKDCVAVK